MTLAHGRGGANGGCRRGNGGRPVKDHGRSGREGSWVTVPTVQSDSAHACVVKGISRVGWPIGGVLGRSRLVAWLGGGSD
jgi:hypothetical protein